VESNGTTCKSRDILSSPWRVLTLYWLTAIAIVLAGAPAISSGWRTVVWTVALATMGVACIVNALRCGRVHRYITGPFFLLMALVALSYCLGILHLGGNCWNHAGHLESSAQVIRVRISECKNHKDYRKIVCLRGILGGFPVG
jgi:hypothetical protein